MDLQIGRCFILCVWNTNITYSQFKTLIANSLGSQKLSWSSIDDVFSLKSDMNKSYQASAKQRQHLDHVIFCWPIHGRIDIQMLLLEIFYQHDLNIEQNPNQVE